jgi:hypothetical protein
MLSFLEKKYRQEKMAEFLATHSENEAVKRLARAMEHSCRILAEDCAREAGYMLPRSRMVKELLGRLRKDSDSEIREIVETIDKAEGPC